MSKMVYTRICDSSTVSLTRSKKKASRITFQSNKKYKIYTHSKEEHTEKKKITGIYSIKKREKEK